MDKKYPTNLPPIYWEKILSKETSREFSDNVRPFMAILARKIFEEELKIRKKSLMQEISKRIHTVIE